MEYLPGMEQIESQVCGHVMDQMKSYDYSAYTASDVRAALNHETCSVEDLKLCFLRRQSRFLRKWPSGPAWRQDGISETPCISLRLCILQITAKITVCTVDLTAITISAA